MLKFKKEYDILKNHFNFSDINNFYQFPESNINSKTYFIQNKQKKYILKYVPGNKIYCRLNKMCQILSHCNKQKILVPEPIRSKSKKFIIDNHYFLTKYYPGTVFDGSNLELNNFAKNLALLHKSLFKIKINYNFEPLRESYKIITKSELLKIKKRINKKQNKKTDFDIIFLNNYELLTKSLSDVIINRKYSKSKKQLIHFDLHPGNVIFRNSNVNVIIDFGSMRKGYLIDDVAFSSFRFAYYKTKNLNKIINQMKYFYNAYTKFNQLPELFYDLPQITKLQILKRLSLILRNYYFTNTSFWISDMEKQLDFLSIIEKIINKWNK